MPGLMASVTSTGSQLAERLDAAVGDGTARAVDADTLMDVIAGGAWYAVCVRRVRDTDGPASDLAELVLRGVLLR